MNNSGTAKRLTGSVAVILLLAFCLGITTYALIYANVTVEHHVFQTGGVKINLNDGQPVIREDEFLFEPGMTVKKDFFIENESTWDVYYRIYLDQVSGGLADVLTVTVKDGDQVLCSGTAAQLNRKQVAAADEELAAGQRKNLTVYFYFPEEKGNQTQNQSLSFAMCAEATQTKNNPDKQFD